MTTIGMLEGGMTVNDVAVSFGVHHMGVSTRLQGPLSQIRICQHPVDQNVLLLEKNVTSGSHQVVTAFYQQQGLSTEYGEQLESAYPHKQSTINLKLVVSNQEDHIKVWS
jgi:hypothetical protein